MHFSLNLHKYHMSVFIVLGFQKETEGNSSRVIQESLMKALLMKPWARLKM